MAHLDSLTTVGLRRDATAILAMQRFDFTKTWADCFSSAAGRGVTVTEALIEKIGDHLDKTLGSAVA